MLCSSVRSGKTIDKLYVLDGCEDGPVRTIVREAKRHDTILNFVGKERLDQISETKKHQGVIAWLRRTPTPRWRISFAAAEAKGEPPFLFLLDNIEDPHNLGAIIRTANLAAHWGDHSQAPRGRSDRDGCENVGGGDQLYPGGEGGRI